MLGHNFFPKSGRKFRILDFDIENRPLSYWQPDRPSAEVTAIASCWVDDLTSMEVLLLNPEDDGPRDILLKFLERYNQADMVTGHYIRCMVPETRVLTDDLRWRAAGDLRPGDGLLAFEESIAGKRRMQQWATVLSNRMDFDDVYAVELETGEILMCTGEHPWLVSTAHGPMVKRRWRRTDELLGAPRSHSGQFAKTRAMVSRVLAPWSDDSSWEAGWLAGFFDGEGSFSGITSSKAQIVGNQLPGAVWDTAINILTQKGFTVGSNVRSTFHRDYLDKKGNIMSLRVNGGFEEKARLLGQIRPVRLLNQWRTLPLGQLRTHSVGIKSVTFVGRREISRLATSSGTYIAEGYAVHNSHDLPIINGALYELGLPLLTPKLTCDTKMDMFKKADVPATQEYLLETLGVTDIYGKPLKKFHLSQTDWREANRLTPAGMAKTRERVASDVFDHIHLRTAMLKLGMLRAPSVWNPGGGRVEVLEGRRG